MKNEKKCKVLLLPTNEKAVIGFLTQKGKERGHLVHFDRPMPNILDSENQHLYFLSDEEIKEGDWFLSNLNEILKCTKREDKFVCYEKLTVPGVSKVAQPFSIHINLKPKKIIATTDKSLVNSNCCIAKEGLTKMNEGCRDRNRCLIPQPSQSFIEKFVEEYNKGNVITEVLVEYETITKRYGSCSIGEGVTMNVEQLKVSKDNTITIRKVKDSWNRDEVMKFGNWCRIHDSKFPNQVWTIQQLFDKWIQENL